MSSRGKHRDETTIRLTLPELARPRASLMVLVDGVATTHPLPEAGDLVVGRSDQCDVQVDDPSLSRRHAVLRVGAEMSIEDLGSYNGTRVGDVRLEPGRPVPLVAGVPVELGSVVVVVQQRTLPIEARRLWGHDHFESRLDEECARAADAGTSFAIVRIGVDGDLDALASDLDECLRPMDVAAVYGPGQWEVLLADADARITREIVERLARRFTIRGVEARLGVATFPEDGRDAQSLIARSAPRAPGAAVADGHVIVDGSIMEGVHRLVARIAKSDINVLILGETGVGKEVLAGRLHELSLRADGPMVRLNCAALSQQLLESELFGHEKGAFTGAVTAKPGLLETARGGTVFLDEIGELNQEIQVKLLRVIEERAVQRVGALQPRPIDVRFVAATNRDLEREIEEGRFRADLFFRLNGVSLYVPPLRERVAEIEPLARAFIEAACERYGQEVPALRAEALELLVAYPWPGNIRELKNVVERAILLCFDGPITAAHLPAEKMRAVVSSRREDAPAPGPAARSAPRVSGDRARDETREVALPADPRAAERQRILAALDECGGNQTRAARLLGISRRTLLKRLDAYGVPRPRKGR